MYFIGGIECESRGIHPQEFECPHSAMIKMELPPPPCFLLNSCIVHERGGLEENSFIHGTHMIGGSSARFSSCPTKGLSSARGNGHAGPRPSQSLVSLHRPASEATGSSSPCSPKHRGCKRAVHTRGDGPVPQPMRTSIGT